jgi:hypothetical protein
MHPVDYLFTRHWQQADASLPFDWSGYVPYQRDTMWYDPAPDPPELWITTPGRRDQRVLVQYQHMMYSTMEGLDGRPLPDRVWTN